MSSASVGRQLAELLVPVVEATGLDLEDVEVSRQGRTHQVRVLVDKDGGVSLDEVAAVSQAVSETLDLPAADAVLGASPYVLEVSSPGIERPLVQPRQWRRSVGRLVRTQVIGNTAVTGNTEVTGRVVSVDEGGVRLAIASAKRGQGTTETVFRFDQLGPGRVQVEFNRPSTAEDTDGGGLDEHDEESG
jgi:ribosome maturation factor RimP